MPSCELRKTTKTIGYAPLFVLSFVKGLNATFKYFERKLSNDGKELERKDIIQFSFNMTKMSLVNETLRLETETFDFQSETRPRRSHISPRRDRDVGKMRLETVSRPRRRDRDYIPAMSGCGLPQTPLKELSTDPSPDPTDHHAFGALNGRAPSVLFASQHSWP